MAAATYSNKDENRFWLQILGDYALLIIDGLQPEDTAMISDVRDTVSRLDRLLARARQDLTPEQLTQLNKNALEEAVKYRNLMLQILNLKLRGNYPFLIDTAFLSNAAAFAQRYITHLNSFIGGKQPEIESPIEQDLFWLPLMIEFAKHIGNIVGVYENKLRQRAETLATDFINLLLFTIELQGMSQIGTEDYPMANEHQKNVQKALQDFSGFLDELYSLIKQNKISGGLTPLYIDKTNRLICYYARHLATVSKTKPPECNPLSPRLSNI
jgi:hypothetical protein